MPSLPTGTVTFLFADVEGSTRLLQQLGEQWKGVVEDYFRLLLTAFEEHGGYILRTEGDGCAIVFAREREALFAAIAAQRSVAAHTWPEGVTIRVRMGMHTGAPEIGGDNYVGIDVHRAARVTNAGYGGQVLLSQATRDLIVDELPEGVGLRDLSTHRLKDLPQPEHIYQLVIAGLPADFPPLKSISNRPHNIPSQLTPLVGRDEEVKTACDVLRDQTRLLTLTGPGGTGKTRLSLQIAFEMLGSCDDGVFIVTLAPLRDPHLVVSTIAQTLGIKEQPGRTIKETLEEALRDKAMLLVLDNFEQVTQGAPEVADLLHACPRLKVLVTSRIALNLRGEQELAIAPLALPGKGSTPTAQSLQRFAAVELFVQRAQAVRPNFTLTDGNAPAVAEICARLDGLPLAIELAASRLKLLSPEAMLGRLESRLKLLTGGARDLPERHQTLRSTIAWSYDLLDEDEKKLFCRLCVFVGGSTLEAAENVGNSAGDLNLDVLDGVSSLVSESLLRQQDDEEGESRFFMLETIREFGTEMLAQSGGQEDAQRRHAEYFGALAEESSLQDSEDDPERRMTAEAQLNRENDNVWAALCWALERDPQLALRIAAYWHTAWHSAYLAKVGEAIERALQKAGNAPPELVSAALGVAAEHAARRGDFARQKELLEKRLALMREGGNEGHVAWALYGLGCNAATACDQETAIARFSECLELFRKFNTPRWMGSVLNPLGSAFANNNDFQAARACYQEAIEVFKQCNDRDGVAGSMSQLADLARREGNLAESRQLFGQVSQIEEELGDSGEHPWRRYQLAGLEMLEGNYESANVHLQHALSAFLKTEFEKPGALYCLRALGCLSAMQNRWERMATLFGAEEAQRETYRVPAGNDWRKEHDSDIVAARAALGEEAFMQFWERGLALNWNQAVEFAQTTPADD